MVAQNPEKQRLIPNRELVDLIRPEEPLFRPSRELISEPLYAGKVSTTYAPEKPKAGAKSDSGLDNETKGLEKWASRGAAGLSALAVWGLSLSGIAILLGLSVPLIGWALLAGFTFFASAMIAPDNKTAWENWEMIFKWTPLVVFPLIGMSIAAGFEALSKKFKGKPKS